MPLTPRLALALSGALALAACGGASKPEPGQKDLGQQAADVAADTQTLRAAQAAANEVVRAAGDCALVKPAVGEALQRLDEATKQVRTATGRTTLEVLRKRVSTVAELCP